MKRHWDAVDNPFGRVQIRLLYYNSFLFIYLFCKFNPTFVTPLQLPNPKLWPNKRKKQSWPNQILLREFFFNNNKNKTSKIKSKQWTKFWVSSASWVDSWFQTVVHAGSGPTSLFFYLPRRSIFTSHGPKSAASYTRFWPPNVFLMYYYILPIG